MSGVPSQGSDSKAGIAPALYEGMTKILISGGIVGLMVYAGLSYIFFISGL